LRDFASRAQRGERDRGERAVARRSANCGSAAIDNSMMLELQADDEPRGMQLTARLVALVSGGTLQQFLGLALQLEAGVLMGLAASERRDALHEIEDALSRGPEYADKHQEKA